VGATGEVGVGDPVEGVVAVAGGEEGGVVGPVVEGWVGAVERRVVSNREEEALAELFVNCGLKTRASIIYVLFFLQEKGRIK